MERLSDAEFESIVLDSRSITEVTKRCGYATYKSGGGREQVIKRIRNNDLDISHFKTTGRQYEKPPHNKIADYKTVLKRNSNASRTTVRDIIFREHLLDYKCTHCGNTGIWNGKMLSLQLHHIDGDIMNNELDNLVFLCPNCHSQTDNYSYKNAKRNKKETLHCSVCGKEISNYSRTGRCKECHDKSLILESPPKMSLLRVVNNLKFKKDICFHYGVSEKTINKWLKEYDLPVHIAELHQYIKENNL